MKSLHYIIGFLVCALFFSCEAEEIIREGEKEQITPEEDGTYLINPEDTAGIVVPEGYRLVLFPGVKKQTRANATGTNTQVKHLQYLIYQKDGVGTYKQIKQTVLSKPESWPSKVPAIPLEENKEYRVVFLGNIDKSLFGSTQTEDLLTGVGEGTNYADARIHLPQVEFDDTNLFYMANSTFDTKAGSITDNSVYVPITLKRIVNKVEICKEPLKDTSKDYTQDNLIEQVLGEKITPKLGSTGGALHRGIAASIDTLVMAMVYVGTKGCASEADNYYTTNPTTYPVLKYRYNNIGIGKEYQLPALKSSLDDIATTVKVDKGDASLIKEDFNYANSDMTQNLIIKLAQYIYDYYHKGLIDDTVNDDLFGNTGNGNISGLWTSNVAYIENSYQDGLIFYFSDDLSVGKLNTLLTNELTTSFKTMVNADDVTDKVKNDFKPWLSNLYKVIVNRMPSVITFDLKVVEYLKETELALLMKKKPSEAYKGSTISVISLGTPDANNPSIDEKLTISKILGSYTTQGWDGNITKPLSSEGRKNILLNTTLTAKQAANKYRKCVNSVNNVNLKDWSKSTTKTYPIEYKLNTLLSQESTAPLFLSEVDKSGVNYKYSLFVNGNELCFEVRCARASNLVTLYSDICKRLKERIGYSSANSYITWIQLPEVKDNLNDYTSGWTITDENYNTVSE